MIITAGIINMIHQSKEEIVWQRCKAEGERCRPYDFGNPYDTGTLEHEAYEAGIHTAED